MDRRTFIAGTSVSLAAPLAAEAQQPKCPYTSYRRSRNDRRGGMASVPRRLQSLGYLEGKTIAVDWRWAGSDARRLTDLAADWSVRKVAVIVTGSVRPPTAEGMRPAPYPSS